MRAPFISFLLTLWGFLTVKTVILYPLGEPAVEGPLFVLGSAALLLGLCLLLDDIRNWLS